MIVAWGEESEGKVLECEVVKWPGRDLGRVGLGNGSMFMLCREREKRTKTKWSQAGWRWIGINWRGCGDSIERKEKGDAEARKWRRFG